MAHFAEVNDDGIVIRVIVTDNNKMNEGHNWLVQKLGGKWIKTSYNTIGGVHTLGGEPLRKNFAGIGMTYDKTRDAFIAPKPFTSWVLNEATCQWESPTPYPEDGKDYNWDEDSVSWVEAPTPEEA